MAKRALPAARIANDDLRAGPHVCLSEFGLSVEEQSELLADYLPLCETVRIPAKPPAIPECRDAFDRPFLELAVVGKADYLVSGDKDLLDLSKGFTCPIVAPEKFLSLLPAP